jgi:hypothetical protein
MTRVGDFRFLRPLTPVQKLPRLTLNADARDIDHGDVRTHGRRDWTLLVSGHDKASGGGFRLNLCRER